MVTGLAFSGDGCLLAQGCDDGSVFLCSLDAQRSTHMPAHEGAITAVAVTRDANLLATAGKDGVVRLWDRTGRSQRIALTSPNVNLLCFSPDGQTLATGSKHGELVVWDVRKDGATRRFGRHLDGSQAMAYSSDSSRLVVVSDTLVVVWDLASGRQRTQFAVPAPVQRAVAFSADGRQLTMVDYQGTITRWDLDADRLVETLAGRRRTDLASFSASVRAVAIAGVHGQIRVRDTHTQADLAVLREFGPGITAIALSPDGRRLAAAAADGTLRIWEFYPGVDAPAWHNAVQQSASRWWWLIAGGWCALMVGSAAAAVVSWRQGVLLCLLVDLLRDPIRKLMPGYPVWVTVSVAVVWLAAAIGFWRRDRTAIRETRQRCRGLRWAFLLTVMAILPSAAISVERYPSGWQLAVLGGGAYSMAWLGLLLGYGYAKSEADIMRWVSMFCCVHLFGALGCFPELWFWNCAALGAVDADWYRSFTTGVIPQLVSGLYRSPDMLGWHAAHLVMLGSILASRQRGWRRGLWLAIITTGVIALLLAGRRKMTVMPLVFLCVWLIGGLRGRRRLIAFLSLLAVIAAMWLPMRTLQRLPRASEFLKYQAWTLDDSLAHAGKIAQGACDTLRDAGLLGHGLGTATQGRYYLAARGPQLAQEDGIGRVVAEGGLYGSLMLLTALLCLGHAAWRATAWGGTGERSLRLPFFAIALANLVCYVVSHQLYSGDATIAAMVGFCLGQTLAPQSLVGAVFNGRTCSCDLDGQLSTPD